MGFPLFKRSNKIDRDNKLWFMDVVNDTEHLARIAEVENTKEYLLGHHDILNKKTIEVSKDKYFEPSKIVINTLKSVIDAHVSYVIANPVSLTGTNQIVADFNKIYRRGNYNQTDIEIVDSLYRYGNAFEYVFEDKGVIKSKIIENCDAFPVYDDHYRYVSFIENWKDSLMGDEFYTVYYPQKVEEYKNGILIDEHLNRTGLPIHFRTFSRGIFNHFGRGITHDLIPIMDYIESLLSKMDMSITKYALNPVSTLSGQRLKEPTSTDAIGLVLNLEEGSEYKPVVVPIDNTYNSMKLLLDSLLSQFYTIAAVPDVVMGQSNPTNISEGGLKMIFTLMENKAKQTMQTLRVGMYQRFEYFRKLLNTDYSDDDFYGLNINFNINRPTNDIDKLKELEIQYKMGAISRKTIIEMSPNTTDSSLEIQRIEEEHESPKKGDNVLQEA